jgi:hypothetical protein
LLFKSEFFSENIRRSNSSNNVITFESEEKRNTNVFVVDDLMIFQINRSF